MWLSYVDDEVEAFHPAFEALANACIEELGKKESLAWIHHDPSSKGGIPDYVLQDLNSQRWLLIVEIKKTRAAVTSSTQYRRQAHSYALENKHRFRSHKPFLYCLTNLEQTHLFGANDHFDLSVSPNARLVETWVHGDFETTPENEHQQRLKRDLIDLINIALNTVSPLTYRLNFPDTWDVISQAGKGMGALLPPVWSGGDYGAWFSSVSETVARGLLLATQCLLAEWIVYQSEQHAHPYSNSLIRFKKKKSDIKNRNHIVDVIQRILQIDFEDVVGSLDGRSGVSTINEPRALSELSIIIGELQKIQLDQLTDLVGNAGLPDLIFEVLQDRFARSRRGTVQTDPELAQVAAVLGIYARPEEELVVDPCAGIGNLLTAVYHVRSSVLPHSVNIRSLVAVEIEPIQSSLAALQLIMQAPSEASKSTKPRVICDSISNVYLEVKKAGVVLMNPPYKRYENDGDPLPDGYRKHLQDSIEKIKGGEAVTTKGQSDLFNYYIELVVSAMGDGARGVFILNNKWMNIKSTLPLRKFLVDQCTIEGVLTYPRSDFFKGHLIATTLLVLRKGRSSHDDCFRFVRCREDLRSVAVDDVANAVFNGVETHKLKVVTSKQSKLMESTFKGDGTWREIFDPPECLSILSKFPKLVDYFESVVQGRLERDEVSKIVSFPFRNWQEKGTKGRGKISLSFLPGKDREPPKGPKLSSELMEKLTIAAQEIPKEYRGYALKTANKMGVKIGFELDINNFSHEYSDGSSDAIIEPPELKLSSWARGPKKAKWDDSFEKAVESMRRHPKVHAFMELIENGLNLRARPENVVWEDLLRPACGEIILLRSFRSGWRAHLNPLAFEKKGPQLRISSNFYSLRGFSHSVSGENCSDDREACQVLVAFLLSSFGQVQFEFFGENREGLRKCESVSCVENVRIPSPAGFSKQEITNIKDLLDKLKCPIDCEVHPHTDPARRDLDVLIAAHMLGKNKTDAGVTALVNSTASALDELQRERLE